MVRLDRSTHDAATDVAIVGAGIAGIATAFFTLRYTDRRVLLVERDRVGAAARRAAMPASSRPTSSGRSPISPTSSATAPAIEAQRAFDDAHDLLDLMVAEAGASVRVERFDGHMGMYNLNHVVVHLRNNLVRRRRRAADLETCVVSEDAEFLDAHPGRARGALHGRPAGAHPRAPRDRRRPLPGRPVRPQGLRQQRPARPAGPGLPRAAYPDRFRYVDQTARGPGRRRRRRASRLHARGHAVTASQVVLCTNGFVDHMVEAEAGRADRAPSTTSGSSARSASWRRSSRSSRGRRPR